MATNNQSPTVVGHTASERYIIKTKLSDGI